MKEAVYVALLRGINVGGNKTVSMAKLKACFEALGYRNVRTYINSGNVIFTPPSGSPRIIVKKIEAALKKEFRHDIRVLLRTTAQMRAVCKKIPADWKNDAERRVDVIFLWGEVDKPGVLKEIETNKAVDTLIYVKGAVIWSFERINYNKSRMRKFIGTYIYKHMTARNVNTTRKLLALMEE
ncbi:MAG: hypothetical protein RL681_179 [Candidatus Parcubacteria bacterium]|jgi:uncharacterized protein (DUF1697 family)